MEKYNIQKTKYAQNSYYQSDILTLNELIFQIAHIFNFCISDLKMGSFDPKKDIFDPKIGIFDPKKDIFGSKPEEQ